MNDLQSTQLSKLYKVNKVSGNDVDATCAWIFYILFKWICFAINWLKQLKVSCFDFRFDFNEIKRWVLFVYKY